MTILLTTIASLILMKNYKHLIVAISSILIITMIKSNEQNLIFNNKVLMDKFSTIMVMLTLMSVTLIIFSSNIFFEISMMMYLILIILMLTFSMTSFFTFYILFEMVLIPTLLMITKTGPQPERLQAGIYLIMYTILASLPLLIGILMMKSNMNMLFSKISCSMFKFEIIFILAFLVKLPMFMFHLWLPKAHVEAPLEGSMILAAILLKLGGYGIIRVMPMILKISWINYWIISISMVGASLTGLNCIRQKDLKALIAYSSVAHMGLIIASLFTLSLMGKKGAIMMMVAHGLSSSALFLLVNIIYSKFHTRNILAFKGLTNLLPNITFWWFMFTSVNISAPPTINLFSEIYMYMSMVLWQPMMMMTVILMSAILTSIFSINLFLNLIHNKPEVNIMENVPPKMFMSLLLHFMPIILFSMKIEMF